MGTLIPQNNEGIDRQISITLSILVRSQGPVKKSFSGHWRRMDSLSDANSAVPRNQAPL